MEGKRGSHVGMIISFVIFITFIVFLYTVVNPIVNVGESKKSVLDYISSKIAENISSNFTTISVDFNNTKNPSKNCIVLENFLFKLGITPQVVVKNATENMQPAYEKTYSLVINRNVKANRFFKVYHSPEFVGISTVIPADCDKTIKEDEYSIGSITLTEYAFEKNLYKLIDYYKADYEKLKNDFDIVPGSEFGFDFIQANKTIITVGELPKSVSIYAEEIPIQYVNNNATILSGFINIKVW
jgi:hypothetical protein